MKETKCISTGTLIYATILKTIRYHLRKLDKTIATPFLKMQEKDREYQKTAGAYELTETPMGVL